MIPLYCPLNLFEPVSGENPESIPTCFDNGQVHTRGMSRCMSGSGMLEWEVQMSFVANDVAGWPWMPLHEFRAFQAVRGSVASLSYGFADTNLARFAAPPLAADRRLTSTAWRRRRSPGGT